MPSAIFTKGCNFCEFMFAFQGDKILHLLGQLLQEIIR